MRRHDREIAQLRALGFAEALRIEPSENDRGVVARLESGQIGVAVEFHLPEAADAYSLSPLLPADGADERVASNAWLDIVNCVRRRMPIDDE